MSAEVNPCPRCGAVGDEVCRQPSGRATKRHDASRVNTPELLMQRHVHIDESGCWLWTGGLNRYGYGQTCLAGRPSLAHRVIFEAFRGPIPSGMHLDHLCRVRHCVNPSHLEPVTPGENVRRGEPATRTHCPRLHEYTPENTRVRGGKRHCLACHRINQRNYLARKAAA